MLRRWRKREREKTVKGGGRGGAGEEEEGKSHIPSPSFSERGASLSDPSPKTAIRAKNQKTEDGFGCLIFEI